MRNTDIKTESGQHQYLRKPSSWLTGIVSATVTEALELAFDDKASSFSSALCSLTFWVWVSGSCNPLISHLFPPPLLPPYSLPHRPPEPPPPRYLASLVSNNWNKIRPIEPGTGTSRNISIINALQNIRESPNMFSTEGAERREHRGLKSLNRNRRWSKNDAKLRKNELRFARTREERHLRAQPWTEQQSKKGLNEEASRDGDREAWAGVDSPGRATTPGGGDGGGGGGGDGEFDPEVRRWRRKTSERSEVLGVQTFVFDPFRVLPLGVGPEPDFGFGASKPAPDPSNFGLTNVIWKLVSNSLDILKQ